MTHRVPRQRSTRNLSADELDQLRYERRDPHDHLDLARGDIGAFERLFAELDEPDEDAAYDQRRDLAADRRFS